MKKRPSTMTLKRKLDKCFSLMIRTRDAELPCISCGKHNELQAGHFVKRKPLSTRWHPWNVNGECCHCNGFDASHIIGYSLGLSERYGPEAGRQIFKLARVRWKVLPDQLIRLIDATEDPQEYERIWFDVQREFAPEFGVIGAEKASAISQESPQTTL